MSAVRHPTDGAEPTTGAPLHYADNDVLTAEEMRAALKVSGRQWTRIAPLLPVSYLLGAQSPRYIYGEVVAVLRKSGAAA